MTCRAPAALIATLIVARASIAVTPAVDAPTGTLVEAEASADAGAHVDDSSASGGVAVVRSKPWEPLCVTMVPTDLTGDGVTVWFRHKGGPIQLKAIADAGQSEKDWIWDKPSAWTWSHVGPYPRKELGQKILLMRGEGAGDVSVDAIVFASAAVKPLPPDRPDAAAPGEAVKVSIDWTAKVAAVPALLWGVNDYEVQTPEAAADAGYRAFVTKLAPPIVRIHRGELPAAWLLPDGKHFDVVKIRRAFASVRTPYGHSKVMLDLAGWPESMNDPKDAGVLATAREDDFAAMCVELMRVMRDEVKQPIDYWELTNERDDSYEKAGRLDDLWRLYNKTYDAMRAFDPNAKLGGPAFTWPKGTWVDGFVANCLAKGKADFVTYHNYAVGDIYDANEVLLSRPDAFEEMARSIRKAVDTAAGVGRHVPIFCDEYNVKWTWEPADRRQANSVGAAFDAGVVRRLALAGIDGAMLWHLKGDVYGILDGKDKVRLTAPLYFWGPRHLVGDAFACDAPSATLEVFAVKRADGGRAVLIANKANHSVDVGAASRLIADAPLYAARVDADGTHPIDAATAAAGQLPGYSLTLFSTAPIAPMP